MMAKKFSEDCYVVNKALFVRYRNHRTEPGEVIDFNHASLARPYKEVFDAVSKKRKSFSSEARVAAASMVSLNDPSRVLFGRNTTEALSFSYWIANVEGGNVIVTDAENESVIRIFREHRDHGNTNKRDGWSTHSDDIISEDYEGFNERKKTAIPLKTVQFLGHYNIEPIIREVDDETRLVVVSQVVRNDGRIIDVKKLAEEVKKKNKEVYVAVDGAQALGNLPKINFNELEKAGVDFYAATPHKTMGSYPLGILYISERAKRNIRRLSGRKPIEQVMMEGMIPGEYRIAPNVEAGLNQMRYTSLVTAVRKLRKGEYLRGNDFSGKAGHVKTLKDYFIERLRREDAEIISEGKEYSPAILSFRLRGRDNSEIVYELQKKGVFCSYISETDNIRVSFDITNTKNDIDEYFRRLTALLNETKAF